MKGWGWVAAALLLTALDLGDGAWHWWPLAIVLAAIGAALIVIETRRRRYVIDHELDGADQ